MNTSDYAIHAFSAFSPIFQDFPRCTPSSLDFVYKAETSVQRAVPVANFHFPIRTRCPDLPVEFGPWDAFCMTTAGMHDNGTSLRFGALSGVQGHQR
jgi:hypothetical protein